MVIYAPTCGDADCASGTPCQALNGDQYKTYSYNDSEPKGQYYDKCPQICDCSTPNCATGSCCGQSISGFIYSDPYFGDLTKKKIKATILAGSTIDDAGSVAEISFLTAGCGSKATLTTDQVVMPIIDGNRLKLKFVAINGGTCGPFGLANVSIHWSVK